MKHKGARFFILMAMAVLLLFPLTASAAVPQTISYQGYLTDSGGTPVNDSKSIVFSLYSASTGGTALWTETQPTVAVANGVYSVSLGSVTPITLPFNVQYYLGVTIGADPEMSPRQVLTSVPYALRAAAVDSETDPQVGTLTNARWCTSDGTVVNCTTNAPVTSETDPQVGTLTNGMWCTTNGTLVNCTSSAPVTSESDPQVGSNTLNYIPKWNGSALVTGTIFDNGNIGIGAPSEGYKLHVKQPYDQVARFESTDTVAAIEIKDLNGIVAIRTAGGEMSLHVGSYLAADEKVRITAAGNVGIGTPAPGEKLTVAGTIETTSGGVKFPDGTMQTTAAAPTWHQILPAAERFVLVMNNNAAVLDKETGLVWEKSPSTFTYTWGVAIYYCANLDVGGRGGWHLPTIEQLASLVDRSVNGSPKLPTGHPFLNVQSVYYWSATTLAASTTRALQMDFYTGGVYNGPKDDSVFAWCVRGGQSHDAY